MIVTSFDAAGIKLGRKRTEGSVKTLCPQCSHLRTKKDDPCLSVTFNKTDTGGNVYHAWNCHHCAYRGAVYEKGIPDNIEKLTFTVPKKHYIKPTLDLSMYDLDDETIDWFKARGISLDTLERYQIKACDKKFGGKKSEPAIIFPLIKGGELINAQFRNLGDAKTKEYRLIQNAQTIFFGIDNVVMDGYVATDTLYIVEGYVDALTLYEIGYPFVLSVPNGSPFETEGKPPVKAPTLEFLDDPDFQYIANRVEKIVLLGDDDHQGRRLMDEISIRIGPEKCWKVQYPKDCKDPNDVLRKYGEDKLHDVITNAVRMPVAGVVRISQIRDRLKTLYNNGPDRGLSTGYKNLDRIFRIGTGKLVVVTGVPESGKTRLVGNILIQAMRLHGIRVSLFTPESRPFENFTAKLISIATGKPFGQPGDDSRLSEDEMNRAIDWLDPRLTYNNPATRNLEDLCAVWKGQLKSEGIHYGVLDPFNYIPRPVNENEGNFVLRSLTYLADWCVTNDFTLFVVVHPTKVEKNKHGEYPVISPYNIYGSSHWFNCADTILSIWRSVTPLEDKEDEIGKAVQIHVMKQKQEELGTSNRCCLFDYDVATGIYKPFDDSVYAIGKGGKPFPIKNTANGLYTEDAQVSVDNNQDSSPFHEEDEPDYKPTRRSRKRGASI